MDSNKKMVNTPDDKSVHSAYGQYTVHDTLELYLPGTVIKIDKTGTETFSYFRQDSKGDTTQKMIPCKSDTLTVELAPIAPLNHPARRTDHIFLKFVPEIHLGQNATAHIFVRCPIEVGLFLVNGTGREPLDWVTCNHANSRFGLYGPPDTGTLCKYAEVLPSADPVNSIPYVDCTMRIILQNSLNSGHVISKVIFSMTDASLYYKDSKSVADGIKVTLKRRAVVSVADVQTVPADSNWTKSPVWSNDTADVLMEAAGQE